MKSEDQVLAALRALAEHDREREAPDHVEVRVRAAFRSRKRRRAAIWSLAAAAAVAAIFLAIPRQHPAPVVVHQPVPPPQVAEVVETPALAPAPKVRPVRRAAAPRAPREIATEFFSLMDVALPFERGQMVRVIVPAATMRTVGLPVSEDRLGDRVQADILIGEEGLARAIRFVRYE